MAERQPDVIVENDTRIRFEDATDKHQRFTAEINRGQSLFDKNPDKFLVLDGHDGDGGWFMTKLEAARLCNWLFTVLADGDAVPAPRMVLAGKRKRKGQA